MAERRRVSADQIRENARQGGRGPSILNLPEGVSLFYPEKEGEYYFDFLPYEVSIKGHPDNVPPGTIWYKREITVHKRVGPNFVSLVCPMVVGKPCPIHEDIPRLQERFERNAKEGKLSKEQEKTLKDMQGKRTMLLNMFDPKDKEGSKRAVFAFGSGKFWKFKAGGLQKEIDQGPKGVASFWDVFNGYTLKVRFSEETMGAGIKYLMASRFDFIKRDDMKEEKVLAKSIDLDKAINILPYDEIKSIYTMQGSDDKGGSPNDDDRPRKRDDDDDKPRRRDPEEDRPRKRDEEDDRPRRRDPEEDKPRRREEEDDRPKRRDSEDDDRPRKREDDEDRPKKREDEDDRPRRSRDDDDDRPRRSRDDD